MGTYLNRTFSGANTSRKIFTLSFWVKRSTFGSMKAVISAETTSNFYDQILFTSGDQFEINNVASGGDVIQYKTNSVFRDPSAWYHVVAAIDTTQASASNGIKIYINGVLQTSLASTTYAQNATFEIGRDGSTTSIGRRQRDTDGYGVGYLSDFHYIDGQQKVATDFGQTDSTTGIWKPKTYSGTYGNNGFRLEFKNAAALGTDTSGNSETFTVNNADTTNQVVDTPSNVFATFNPVVERPGDGLATFAQGALQASGTSKMAFSSIALPSSGKWYAEFKANAGSSTASVGLRDVDDYTADGNSNRLYYRNDGQKDTGSGASSYGSSWTTGDILSIACNVDSNQVTFYKNGTAQDSGTAISQNCANQYLMIATAGGWSFQANFGNPSFSISSGNADANGYGNFEYAVPSGYYALCTENLNTYG